MLYRYPIPRRTTGEIVVGSKRNDLYTGEELPPLPYMYSGTGNKAEDKTAAAKKTQGNSTAPAAGAAAESTAVQAASDSYRKSGSLLKRNLEGQLQAAQKANDEAMRQLYIAYMEGIKNMSQQAALWGAGGEIESLKTRKRTNYEDNRARQNEKYMGILGEIQQKYNSDLLDLEERYLRQLMQL